MESIIFIAPPAAGKGTQSKLICDKYHVPHISTGDLLRDASSIENERGKYIKEQMRLGTLVSDELILELLDERLKEKDCDHGYVLDGFPRNLDQAIAYEKILEKQNKKLGIVIFLNVKKEVACSRIEGRISCLACGSVYNKSIDEDKPKKEGICDYCGSLLIKRQDDNIATFEVRYDTYLEKINPLLQYYQKKNILYYVESENKQETFVKILEILEGRIHYDSN